MTKDQFVVFHRQVGKLEPVEQWGPFFSQADAISHSNKMAARPGFVFGIDQYSYRFDDETIRRGVVKA